MSDISRTLNRVGLGALTGQQKYVVQVASEAHHQKLSVVAFEAIERMGEPYRITVQLTYEKALSRADYLGREVTFTMDAGDGTAPSVYAGCITQFSKTKTTSDFHAYEFVIEGHAAKLRITESCRTFQQNTGPEIIERILRKHGFEGHQFRFKLRHEYVKHAFCFQYQMSDWAYVHMLMQKEGIFCYTEQGEHGDVLVFGDDLDHYVYQPVLMVPYREMSGLQSAAIAVTRLRTDAKLVPKSVAAIEYSPLSAWELHQAQVNTAQKDLTTYGDSSHFATGQMDYDGAKREASLRHEAALAQQVVYDGVSNISALRPGRVFQMDEQLPDAPDGQLVIEVRHSGARDSAYRNTYKAIPADRPYRLPFAPHSWPRIAGTLSARVTAPKGFEYAYLTDDGRYTVRLSCDAGPWEPGGESVPLRLAKPFAGGRQTGMHFPVLPGTEAVIGFRDGDPDKPYIVAFHHTDLQPDLVNRQERRYTRNLIETHSGNQQGMEDCQGQEGINLSTEHSGRTQLNLGYLPDADKKARGHGFELRSGGKGALRGGQGLALFADDQPGAKGKQLEMQATIGRLEYALQGTEALAEAARVAKADAAGHEAQATFLRDAINDLKKAIILLSAPDGIAAVSGGNMQLSAKDDVLAFSGGETWVSTLKRFIVNAGQGASLFVQKGGMKLFAAKGDVEMEAQSGQIKHIADQHVRIKSVKGRVEIEAKEEILLKCGGSYLRITPDGIEDGTKGQRTMKCAQMSRQGPASVSQSTNQWDTPHFEDPYKLIDRITGDPLSGYEFEIARSDGSIIRGTTDKDGSTNVQKDHDVEAVRINIVAPKKEKAR